MLTRVPWLFTEMSQNGSSQKTTARQPGACLEFSEMVLLGYVLLIQCSLGHCCYRDCGDHLI